MTLSLVPCNANNNQSMCNTQEDTPAISSLDLHYGHRQAPLIHSLMPSTTKTFLTGSRSDVIHRQREDRHVAIVTRHLVVDNVGVVSTTDPTVMFVVFLSGKLISV